MEDTQLIKIPKKRGRKKQNKTQLPKLNMQVDLNIFDKYNKELRVVGFKTIKEVLKIMEVPNFRETETKIVQKLDGILNIEC